MGSGPLARCAPSSGIKTKDTARPHPMRGKGGGRALRRPQGPACNRAGHLGLGLVARREVSSEISPSRPVLSDSVPVRVEARATLREGLDVFPQLVYDGPVGACPGSRAGRVSGVRSEEECMRESVLAPGHMP